MIFDYPQSRTARRHGPIGYRAYGRYRPWLRDEFAFRCAYCLKREAWGQVTFDFEIDHFQPVSIVPSRKLDYSNLVYSCHSCNKRKRATKTGDPFILLTSDKVRMLSDGALRAADHEAEKLIEVLDLNSERHKDFRLLWSRIERLASQNDRDLWEIIVGFPSDLPDLSQEKVRSNSRPKGIQESWFARRQRGMLPASY